MKTLSAREYLGQLQELDTNINQDLERLNDMKNNACSTGGIDYSAERVQTSPSGDSLCKAVTNYVDFNEQINREIDKFSDAKEQIIKQIRGLHNARYSQVLFKVYVQFKSSTMFIRISDWSESSMSIRMVSSAKTPPNPFRFFTSS